MDTQERFRPVRLDANAAFNVLSIGIGGFLAKTSGTVTLTRGNDNILVIDAFPVTAGQWYPMPFLIGERGGIFTCAGGASGTLAVG